MEGLLAALKEGEFSDTELDELKVACRDAANARLALETPGALEMLVESKSDTAWMVLANILHHHSEARRLLSQKPLIDIILSRMMRMGGERVYLRVLFLVTIDEDGARAVQEFRPHLLEEIVGYLKRDEDMIAVELLRVLYNVTRFKGDDEFEGLNLEGTAWKCLEYANNPSVTGNIFNLFMNVTNFRFLPQNAAELLLKGIGRLLDWMNGEERREAVELLPSGLLTMARVCEASEVIRKTIRHLILPATFDRQVSVDVGNEIKAQLARILQHPDGRLSGSGGDMLFILVRKRVERLVYHFGYGVTAGYLYSRELLNAAGTAEDGLNLGDSSDEEVIEEKGLTGIDPVTGRFATESIIEGEIGMTEDEMQRENERLIDLLERLERTGVMKVYAAKEGDANQ
jgi:hypothetical protein